MQRKGSAKRDKHAFDRQLHMEVLDPRQMLSITVNTLVDELDNELVNDISLRDAIAAAPIGETINFSVTGTINLDAGLGSLVIDKELILDGPGANLLIIDAGNQFRVIDITLSATQVTIDGLTIAHGLASGTGIGPGDVSFKGGGIRSLATGLLTITESTIRDNATNGTHVAGGGLFSQGAVKLERSTVSGNVTVGDYGYGGGIASNSTVNVYLSTIRDNSTNGKRSAGGGVFAALQVTAKQSTVSGNITVGDYGYGAGIACPESVHLYLSTVSGNRTEGFNSHGAGIYAASIAALSSTVTDNHALVGNAGGIFLKRNAVIENSIVAENTSIQTSSDLLSTFPPTVTYSLIGDNAGTTLMEAQTPDVDGNLIGSAAGGGLISPQLGPLADNGGRTFTRALTPTSPAIDAGNPFFIPGASVSSEDQRGNGFSRVYNGRIDMGAFEYRESADFDADGFVTGLDFLLWQIGRGISAPLAVRHDGDADNDLDVDALDLGIWEIQYGGPAPIAAESVASSSGYFSATQFTDFGEAPSSEYFGLVDAAMAWWDKTNAHLPAAFVLEEPAPSGPIESDEVAELHVSPMSYRPSVEAGRALDNIAHEEKSEGDESLGPEFSAEF